MNGKGAFNGSTEITRLRFFMWSCCSSRCPGWERTRGLKSTNHKELFRADIALQEAAVSLRNSYFRSL